MQAEVEDLLQGARVEGRHVQRGEGRLGRAGQRGALAAGVVADEGERSATGTRQTADHHIGKKVTPARPPNLRHVQTS